MIAAALPIAAALAPTSSAADAERAFNADAQRLGQWTAFRKYADRDAVIFTPQAAWARDFLRGRKDPPHAISWRAAVSYVSCDGRTAVDMGPWYGVGGRLGGTFTTVWQRTPAGWRWVYAGGGPLAGSAVPRAGVPAVHAAACTGKPTGAPVAAPPPLSLHKAAVAKADNGRGESADRTLGWDWQVTAAGTRHFRLFQWTGRRYAQVVSRTVPAR